MGQPLSADAVTAAPQRRRRGWWLRQLHTWHWLSAAVSLIGMLLFAITGITLNHAAMIGATPIVVARDATLPKRLLAQPKSADAPLPAVVAAYIDRAVGLDAAARAGEWSDGEVYVALPRPGGAPG